MHNEHPLRVEQPLWKTLDQTFSIYSKHVRTFLLVSAIVWIPATLLQSVVKSIVAHAGVGNFALEVGATLFPAIPLAIAFFIQSAAIDIAVATASLGERPTVEGSYVGALRKIVPLFIVSVLYGLIIVAGGICFVVPAFIFMCRYAFALPIVVVEGLAPTQAMTRSALLTEGRKARLFWIFVVIGLVNGAVGSLFETFFGRVDAPFIGPLLHGLPGILTAALCPIAVMVEYLSARANGPVAPQIEI